MADLSAASGGAPISARIEPATATVGSWLTLTLHLTPTRALPAGCTVRAQLPRSWHVWHSNSAKGVHSTDPAAPNFVSAESTDPGLALAFEVEEGTTAETSRVNTRYGIDGRQQRYNYVARLQVVAGTWQPGVALRIIFGDRRHGSPGFSAALHPEGPEPVLIAVDEHASGHFEALPVAQLPTLEAYPAEAVEVRAIVPTVAGVGETSELRVVALDRFHNAAALPGGLVAEVIAGEAVLDLSPLESNAGTGGLPAAAATPGAGGTLPPGGQAGRLALVGKAPGVVRVRVRSASLVAVSNPMLVTTDTPIERIYWGDLHVHSDDSYDATGGAPYAYGRDVAALDFMALTNHSEAWASGTWQEERRRCAEHLAPGRFVTILAYEGTFNGPYGHHNVYFAGDDGPVIGNDRGTLLDVWAALDQGRAITVPHHTGIIWYGNPKLPVERRQPLVDWTIHDPEFRRLVEVYSSHGQCETYDPSHPLAYENIRDFSIAMSSPGPHWAQDGWLAGHELGTACASDDHAGQAGKAHTGLTALRAGGLDRPAIFDALRRRATYGTTGARIYLDFRLAGSAGGQRLAAAGMVEGSVRAVGTDAIAWVELLRGDVERHELRLLERWEPGSDELDTRWSDRRAPDNGFYYVRLMQAEAAHGRAVMAWSSPIWVSRAQE